MNAMTDDRKTSRLGRGLAALIGDDEPTLESPAPTGIKHLPIALLEPNPYQPRHRFAEEDLRDLTDSIRAKGVLQPILVRPGGGEADSYQIVAGERRWRAAQAAGLHELPVLIKELSDTESLEIALIENIQRADLNPIEEAAGYERLMQEFDYTQEQLSELIGKSRSHVTNTRRLLSLPDPVQEMLIEGDLTAGHARALVGRADAIELAREIAAGGLSVREAEDLGRRADRKKPSGQGRRTADKDADTRALENNISDALGLAVAITHRGDRGGEIKVKYKTLEQLDEICRRLAQVGNEAF